MRMRRGWLALLVLMMILGAGCTGSGRSDKAGSSRDPVVLHLYNGYGCPDCVPGMTYFAQRVGQLSWGALQIQVVNHEGVTVPQFEQDVLRDVQAGRMDLAWVGTRVFDTFGLKSFQALTAPMLIDSYPLERAVLASEIPSQMLETLPRLGVTGLAVLEGRLRKPIAVDQPLLGPSDWRGITFAIIRSEGQDAAIRALGASTSGDWASPELDGAIEANETEGFEKDIYAYRHNGWERLAPYVTANVSLWPQTVALVGNPDRLSALTDQQRGWLSDAAKDALARSTSLIEGEDQVVADVCAAGARLANASDADLAWLRESFASVYEELEQDPQTKTFIDRIEELKASTSPGPALSIPAGCTGSPPHGTADDPIAGTWVTDKLTETQIVQAFIAAGGSEKEGHAFFAQLGGGSTTFAIITLQFQAGQFLEFEAGDGRSPVQGAIATYEIGPDHTLTMSGCPEPQIFRFEQSGDSLRLHVVKACTGHDAPYGTTLFATFPFTRTG